MYWCECKEKYWYKIQFLRTKYVTIQNFGKYIYEYNRVCHIFLDFNVSRYIEGYSFWGVWETETANRAKLGQLQFWSEPSEILNLRSSITPKTVALNIPWYQTFDTP